MKPSAVSASLRVTNGRLARAVVQVSGQAVATCRALGQRDLDAGFLEPGQSGAHGPRIGIADADHGPTDLCGHQQVGAGRPSLALVRTGFERDVKGRPARCLAGLFERHGLGMRTSAGTGPAPADHDAVFYQDGPDGRIGTAQRARALGEAGRRGEPPRVGSDHLAGVPAGWGVAGFAAGLAGAAFLCPYSRASSSGSMPLDLASLR